MVFQTIQKNNPGLPCKLVAVCLLSVKVGTVVIHTPQVKQLSAMASGSEGNFEASFQVLLIAFTWLAGASTQHKMHEKTFEEKVVLVSTHTLISSLAAVYL